jgi:hypothetical protein
MASKRDIRKKWSHPGHKASIQTSLYELMEAIQKNFPEEDDRSVAEIMVHLMDRKALKSLPPPGITGPRTSSQR